MTEVERKIPVRGLPHLRDQRLKEGHRDLGGNVDISLIEEEPDILSEQISHVLEHLSVPAGSRLLKQETLQTIDRIPTTI